MENPSGLEKPSMKFLVEENCFFSRFIFHTLFLNGPRQKTELIPIKAQRIWS